MSGVSMKPVSELSPGEEFFIGNQRVICESVDSWGGRTDLDYRFQDGTKAFGVFMSDFEVEVP